MASIGLSKSNVPLSSTSIDTSMYLYDEDKDEPTIDIDPYYGTDVWNMKNAYKTSDLTIDSKTIVSVMMYLSAEPAIVEDADGEKTI